MTGRASFCATEEQRRTVRAMAGYGIPQDEIARVVINPATGRSITRKTLARHCADEIATGATEENAKVAQSLYRQAVDGHVTAAIFWCKTRMGWRETPRGAAAVGIEAGGLVIESRIELGGDGPSHNGAGDGGGSRQQTRGDQGGADEEPAAGQEN